MPFQPGLAHLARLGLPLGLWGSCSFHPASFLGHQPTTYASTSSMHRRSSFSFSSPTQLSPCSHQPTILSWSLLSFAPARVVQVSRTIESKTLTKRGLTSLGWRTLYTRTYLEHLPASAEATFQSLHPPSEIPRTNSFLHRLCIPVPCVHIDKSRPESSNLLYTPQVCVQPCMAPRSKLSST